MLDFGSFPSLQRADVQRFEASSVAGGDNFRTWQKPRGCSMVYIFAIGSGGPGGNGVVGAASTAAGGGGGASSPQATWIGPAFVLPDTLYISVGARRLAATGLPTRIAISPDTVANNCLLLVNGGNNGGNAAGATAGAAGVAVAAPSLATSPLAGLGIWQPLAGQAGIIGGTTGVAANLTLPVTGLVVMGGTGGAGVGIAAAAGTNGGSITGAGVFPTLLGGIGGAGAGGSGQNGFQPIPKLNYFFGGTGGASAAASGTFSGGPGGNGPFGCGGGGGGGSFTGGAAQAGGFGGPGLVLIVAW